MLGDLTWRRSTGTSFTATSFARQRDVMIRSDVTFGVHPPNAFFSSLLQW